MTTSPVCLDITIKVDLPSVTLSSSILQIQLFLIEIIYLINPAFSYLENAVYSFQTNHTLLFYFA